jgi:UDP-2-acetamido-3-amino-2,3-dideoxy-glucuronate N-acetyltransferase
MPEFFVHETAIVDEGAKVGSGTHIWHFSHIMKNASIGEKCNLGQNVFIASGVIIGNNVKIQNNVSVYEGVICEDDVFLGPSCVFTNIKNPRSAIVRKGQYAKTIVRRGASIGANATIVCGIEIGQYAFIAAGAVVTKNVLPHSLLAGNPAVSIGWMSAYGHRLNFDNDGKAICPESGEKYFLKNAMVNKEA